MKRNLIRVLAAMLTLVMLVTALYVSPMGVSAEEATSSDAPVLAYVPLDDRPVVCDRVQYAAVAAGFDIQFPPDKSWYQTHLDNQLFNEDDLRTECTNEEQVGSGLRIMDWLEDMEDAGCNHYIIHLDMMFSGGLVGSRFPDTHYESNGKYLDISEQLAIAERLAALTADADNHVYFVETVVRLASTGGFKGYQNDMYEALRSYSKQERHLLDANNWTNLSYSGACSVINEILDAGWYQKGPYVSGTGYPKITFNSPLTQEKVDLYHLARHRKLRLINYMMQYAPSAYYVIGVDDASPSVTIQTNDINFIKTRMGALGVGYSLFADTDSAALMALARCSVDYHLPENKPTVRVRYYGNRASEAADQYDIGTLTQNVTSHIECMGAKEVTSGADVEVLILTRIGDKGETTHPNYDIYKDPNNPSKGTNLEGADVTAYNKNIADLIERASYNINNNIPTIVMDGSVHYTKIFYDDDVVSGYTLNNLQDELLESGIEIGRLLGYSNWNTVGNTLGIGFGQGMSRYAYLTGNATKTAEAHIAAAQSITYSYVKDIAYVARHKLNVSSDKANTFFIYYFYNRHTWDSAIGGFTGWSKVNGNMFESMTKYVAGDSHRDWETCNTERYIGNLLSWLMGSNAQGVGGTNSSHVYSDSYLDIVGLIQGDMMYTDLSGETCEMRAIKSISLSNFRFPWYRIFECTFNIAVELDDVYQYSGEFMNVSAGTKLSTFVEDVRLDKTAQGNNKLFGSAKTYDDYAGRTYSLATPGPAIYTADTVASADVTRAGNGSLVGTGYKVTVKGTTYETVVKADVIGAGTAKEGDGIIGTADAREVLRYVVGNTTLSAAQQHAADMDDGGADAIGTNDARRILQHALGLTA